MWQIFSQQNNGYSRGIIHCNEVAKRMGKILEKLNPQTRVVSRSGIPYGADELIIWPELRRQESAEKRGSPKNLAFLEAVCERE